MIQTIYYIILGYFLLGGVSFYFINRKKEREAARKNWTKFISYFIIIHVLFFSIVWNPPAFRYVALVILLVGAFELIKVFSDSDYRRKGFFTFSLILFALCALAFFNFSGLERGLILFSFLILSIFDSFSQISGQLFGKKKLLPAISPNKTVGGLVGGALVALLSGFLLKDLYAAVPQKAVLLAASVVLFAFLGDVAASIFKRKYGVKDYSNLLPGQGGFLDRFDSLLVAGAWVAIADRLLGL